MNKSSLNRLCNKSRVSEMLPQKQKQIKAEIKVLHTEMKALVDDMSNSTGILPTT